MDRQPPSFYKFDSFLFETSKLQLSRDGQVVYLPPKVSELLFLLLRKRGQVVTKDVILAALWPKTFVTEANLNQTIYILRKALKENHSNGTYNGAYIETIKKIGYCFAAEAQEIYDEEEAPVEEESSAQVTVKDSPPDGDQQVSSVHAANQDVAPDSLKAARGRRMKLRAAAFIGLAALLIVSVSFFVYRLSLKSRLSASNKPVKTIAILPFKTISENPEDELLGIGLTDILITKLGYLKQLVVRPTSTVFKYTDQQYDPIAVGRDLKVDAVLDGTVQKIGERVRVSLRLINVDDGNTQWAEIYDEPFTNVFAVQDAIAQRVAYTLNLNLAQEDKVRMGKQFTKSPEAYQAYARGIFFWNTRLQMMKCIEYFTEAVTKDPDYALAYAMLADSYGIMGVSNLDERQRGEDFEKARRAALRSIQLDESLPEAHSAMFLIKKFHDYDREGAEKEIRRAIELNPGSAMAHLRLAFFYRDDALMTEAESEHRRVLELDPVSMMANAGLCEVLYFKGDYDQALGYCREALELEPKFYPVKVNMVLIAIQKKNYEEATELLNSIDVPVDPLCCYDAKGYLYAQMGQWDKTREELQKLAAVNNQVLLKHDSLAMLYSVLGDRDNAFLHLRAEISNYPSRLPRLKYDPRFASLRADPRFAAFIKERFGDSAMN